MRLFLNSLRSLVALGKLRRGSSRHVRCVLLIALFLSLSALFPVAQTTRKLKPKGRIEGTVLDEQGRPVKNVQVHAVSERTGMYMPGASTDDEGRFLISELGPGTYKIFAESERDAYPDTSAPFYGNRLQDEVSLEPTDMSTTSVLRLGPKAGILTGNVIDEATGKTVVSRYNLAFILKQKANPDRSIEIMSPPQFRLLVPPAIQVTLDVLAEGYETWSYVDPLNPMEHLLLRLESGQEMPIVIVLKPRSKQPPPNQ